LDKIDDNEDIDIKKSSKKNNYEVDSSAIVEIDENEYNENVPDKEEDVYNSKELLKEFGNKEIGNEDQVDVTELTLKDIDK